MTFKTPVSLGRLNTQQSKVYFAHFREQFDECFAKARTLDYKESKKLGLIYSARWLAYCKVVNSRKDIRFPVNVFLFDQEWNVILESKKKWYHKLLNL